MFLVGILIGIYAYFLFALGLLGLLNQTLILGVTVILLIGSVVYFFKKRNLSLGTAFFSHVRHNRFSLLLFGMLVTQAVVNLVGALGPELAFDALWYHLTLPKIYLQEHVIRFIPGSLFYYSLMPKLTEMLYTAAIAVHSEIAAKVIHFLFGIGCCVVLYQLAKKYFSLGVALLVVVIFYSNLVVGWESITAYVDLARTFFELLAVFAFLQWTEENDRNYLALTGVMVGLAISTKLLALGTAAIFLFLVIYVLSIKKKPVSQIIPSAGIFLLLALCIPLPWFVFSTLHSGNPVYPFFTSIYDSGLSVLLLSPNTVVHDLWEVFTRAADPISPIYLMFLPLLFVWYKRFPKEIKLISLYSVLGLIVWYFTPRTGGGRFLLPYLPAFSLLAGAVLYEVQKQKIKLVVPLYHYLVVLVLIVSAISIGFRGVANAKYIPVELGLEKKEIFMSRELNFSYGDFYDTEAFFKHTLKPGEKVLLYGFHNLFYVDFPYLHETTVQRGDRFSYIAVQNGVIPKRFRYWPEIYYNPITNVAVYSLGGQEWVY